MRNSFRAYSVKDREFAEFKMSEEFEIQQGTGIFDKNDNEIFEGDYLYLEDFDIDYSDETEDYFDLDEVREVQFKDGCFIVVSLWDEDVYCNIDMINPNLSKIVGNVFKRPLTSDRIYEV